MLIKIYALVWALAAAAGILFAVNGNLSETTLTIFGFLFSTLFFLGIFGVLPWGMNKWYSRYAPQN